jgi:hypothetical protein
MRADAMPVQVRCDTQGELMTLEIRKADMLANVVLNVSAIDKPGQMAATVNGVNLDAAGQVLAR